MKKKWYEQSDVMLGITVIAVVAMLVIPLPGVLLDILLALSLTIGLITLLTSMSVTSPADFSVFPTLLLGTTIFRIGLNVSTTRMILSKGENADSYIIDAFASFVLGGEGTEGRLVIGFVIYLILVLVQIMVVAKGATRVAEVAARFALDSLQVKSLAIDTDLQAGRISQDEARVQKKRLEVESNFYGAMDGATKFVQGDVRLGLVITAINIIGGLIVGMVIYNNSFAEAADIYISFTIGDGLASQLPALLITTATGMIVTRSAGEDELPAEVQSQMLSRPKTLWTVSGALIAAAFVPGFPTFTLFVIAGILGSLAWVMQEGRKVAAAEDKEKEEQQRTAPRQPEDYLKEIKVEPLEIELGYSLTPFVSQQSGGVLLEQINNLRHEFVKNYGLIIPPIRIRDNMMLAPEEYQIKVMGIVEGRGTIKASSLMAIDTGRVSQKIDGDDFIEPSYNRPAIWIDPDRKHEAENAGYSVVTPETILITHLQNIIARRAPELLNRQQVQKILDKMKEENSAVLDELSRANPPVQPGEIQVVLQNLIRENVSIRNMPVILETIADHIMNRSPDYWTEEVRRKLHRQIVNTYMNEEDTINVATLDPSLDRLMRQGLSARDGVRIALAPARQQEIYEALEKAAGEMAAAGLMPLFVVASDLRPAVSHIMEKQIPNRQFAVLSYDEVQTQKLNVTARAALVQKKEEETIDF